MTSRTIHEYYSYIILYNSKPNYKNAEHKICYKLVLFTCSVHRWLASYGEKSKIVSANVSTEPSCELVTSFPQNSLPGSSSIGASSSQKSLNGGSLMEVNTDIKKDLRGDYTCCVPRCYSNTKRDKELSFHKFPRVVFLREKWGNSIKRKDFIPGENQRVCSLHFHSANRQGRSDVPIILPLLPQSKQRKPPKICLPLVQPKGKKLENEN